METQTLFHSCFASCPAVTWMKIGKWKNNVSMSRPRAVTFDASIVNRLQLFWCGVVTTHESLKFKKTFSRSSVQAVRQTALCGRLSKGFRAKSFCTEFIQLLYLCGINFHWMTGAHNSNTFLNFFSFLITTVYSNFPDADGVPTVMMVCVPRELLQQMNQCSYTVTREK